MTKSGKVQFLALAGASLQESEWLQERTPSGKQIKELDRLKSHSHKLLDALNKLSIDSKNTLRTHAVALPFDTTVTDRLSEVGATMATNSRAAFLDYLWDAAQDMETAAGYAISQMKSTKTDRPSQRNVKRLIDAVARDYYAVQKKAPSYSKNSEFVGFISALVAEANFFKGSKGDDPKHEETGQVSHLVEVVVKKLKESGVFVGEAK